MVSRGSRGPRLRNTKELNPGSPYVPPKDFACHLLCYRSDLGGGELPFFLHLAR